MSGCPALRLSGLGLTLDGEPGLDSEQRGRGLLALWVSGLGLTAEHGPEPLSYLGPHSGGLTGVDTRSGHRRLPRCLESRVALPASRNARAL